MAPANPAIEDAFVLGAGLGTRLRTLTEHCPKPLIPIFGKPLITFAFDRLLGLGIRRLVINTHHCHEAYQAAFPEGRYRGVPLVFEHEPTLLETAGGIKNVERHLQGAPFIVYNGDILSSLPLEGAMAHHMASGNEVTLVLRSEGGPLHISLDPETGRVADIANRLGRDQLPRYLFTGIYFVQPEFLRRIQPHTKISVIPIFMEMIQSAKGALGGVVVDEGCWWDLGTREKYLEVHHALAASPDLFPAQSELAQGGDLEGLLSADQVIPEMKSTDRWGAIAELIDLLVRQGKVRKEDRESVLGAVRTREETMSTGIGFGTAIPHASSDRVQKVVAAFGRCPQGIDFASLDHLPVKFIVLFLVPKDQFQTHLRALSAITGFLKDPSVRARLAEAKTGRDILQDWPVAIRPTARIAPDARLSGTVVAGARAVIESGAQVTDCILWEEARVSAGSVLERCIVTAGQTAAGRHVDADF